MFSWKNYDNTGILAINLLDILFEGSLSMAKSTLRALIAWKINPSHIRVFLQGEHLEISHFTQNTLNQVALPMATLPAIKIFLQLFL